mmetsp:Transcript_16195/g.30555  ORF Transcript_16195/g.30555 Transcript_16195/m.30555 type:complete len:393 (+) Transcript_16195:192-1370(+)|eukprot:CAMPEP_0201664624 /NCGR_PEP_ID=MMETSP0494-20130426/6024_1 /ASSEMBLY_ACC=CAM_ASM_000839 /TAXON_ID=420259 /ORGANISM="Thalassiosira gravida, Strain GMp14c1" /LENGTH=392 /DNA_ID=CAMNT_0048143421 /DNA_START=100 /DNA_END=1278 /DNA_ORIENTATION=+
MAESYGSIQTTDPKVSVESGGDGGSSSNRKIFIPLAVILVGLGIYLRGGSGDDGSSPKTTTAPVTDEQDELPEAEHWPKVLTKFNDNFNPNPDPNEGPFPYFVATNTAGVDGKGWKKSEDVPCDPMLGEEWLFNGERSSEHSVALHFTPAVGGVPGVLSAIEVDYYGHVAEKLVGLFFGEEKTSNDGTYRSISVALRNGDEENLCDTETPVAPGNPAYVTISPGMANMAVPTTEDEVELKENGWQEGSCLPAMGYHWEKFIEPVVGLPYQAGDMVPIVPMYSSTDKTLNGIFFAATGKKQHWPVEECPRVFPGNPCAFGKLNMWDFSAGLTEESAGPFYMCSNFCGECEFTGTDDGWFTTMHFMFKNTVAPGAEVCAAGKCRSGILPKKVDE